MTDSAIRVTKPKKTQGTDPFGSIKGYSAEVSRLRSVAEAVKGIASGKMAIGSMPVGIMLSGQPGMGKTTLAKAFGEATGLPVVDTTDVLTVDLIHDLYEKAKSVAPAIVLVDDVDKIVPDDSDDGYSSDESRAALKEFISQLDGLSKADNVITVMTTNGYDYLDTALKRPGRIDIHIPIGRPNDSDRLEILRYYMSQYGDAFSQPGLAEAVAKKTYKMSCSALKTIVNDVWLQHCSDCLAGRQVDWIEAYQRRIIEFRGDGLLKKSIKNDNEFRRICYHEAGHAIVEYALTGNTSDICVMQVAGRDNGGWTSPRENDSTRYLWDFDDCMNELAATLGGLVAEVKKCGKHTLGVSSDMEYATSLIADMLGCNLDSAGYDEEAFRYSPIKMPGEHYAESALQMPDFAKAVGERQARLLQRAYRKAYDAISTHMEMLDALAEYLYDNGIASGENMEAILEQAKRKEGAS